MHNYSIVCRNCPKEERGYRKHASISVSLKKVYKMFVLKLDFTVRQKQTIVIETITGCSAISKCSYHNDRD